MLSSISLNSTLKDFYTNLEYHLIPIKVNYFKSS